MEHKHASDGDAGMKTRSNTVFIVFLVIGAVFLVTEHRAHLGEWIPYWPYLLLLACPLMHLFMHGGPGHGSRGAGEASNGSSKEDK